MVRKLRDQNNNQSKVAVHQSRELYSGPIPHPDQLERYENISTGAADRIIAMAENEQKNRHLNDKSSNRLLMSGLIFAFIVVMSALLGGLYLIINDKNVEGFSLILGGLAPIIALFIFKN